MVNVLLDAEFVEREHTADAEEIFLLDAVFPVTAIEAVSDAAVVFGVEFVVSVEEVERDATHVGSPECGVHHEVGVGHIHDDLIAVGVEDAFDGEAVKVLGFIVRNLLSVHGERLSEVAVAIEEADSHHVHVAVRSLLEVVTGEDAETAGVNLQHVRETIFHAEVSHGSAFGIGLHVHVLAEVCIDLVHLANNLLVFGEFDETVVVNAAEQVDGVTTHFVPKLCVQGREEVKCFCVPAPPEVVGQFVKFLERLGNVAFHVNHFP